MQFWIGLVAGILIGWLVEWVIDWLFWRRATEASLAAASELRRTLHAAQNEIADLRRQLAESGPATAQSTADASTADAEPPDAEQAEQPDAEHPRSDPTIPNHSNRSDKNSQHATQTSTEASTTNGE